MRKGTWRLVVPALTGLMLIGLAGCGILDNVLYGSARMAEVETALERATGVKPKVGFTWSNGRLTEVTVLFPRTLQDKPLPDLAGTVRAEVTRIFETEPGALILAFRV